MDSARLLCLWGFSRLECWNRLSCLPPGPLPKPGIKPSSPALQVVDSLLSEPPGKPKNTRMGNLSLLQEVKVAHSCPTLCDPMDCSLSGSSVHGILQARIPKWVAISFSREYSQIRNQTGVSCIAGGFFTRKAQPTIYVCMKFYSVKKISFRF